MIIEHLPTFNRIKVIYNQSILTYDKHSVLEFVVDSEGFDCRLMFQFSKEGIPLTISTSEDLQNKRITYTLHNWDSDNWVEIKPAIRIEFEGNTEIFLMKFRNTSSENYSSRKFEITIWKEIKNI